jgi:predicted DNA-binding protein
MKEGGSMMALNAGLKFINNPTMENAVAMTEPFSNDWTKKFDELERHCEKAIADNKLLREALEVACEEIEDYSQAKCPTGFITWEIPADCDNDCGVCLKNYFMQKAQERIDMRRNNEEVKNEL